MSSIQDTLSHFMFYYAAHSSQLKALACPLLTTRTKLIHLRVFLFYARPKALGIDLIVTYLLFYANH